MKQRLLVLSSVSVLCNRWSYFLQWISSLEFVNLTSNFFTVSFWFLFLYIRSCFYYWVDPPPLNKIFAKFDLGGREGNRFSRMREYIGEVVVWEIFELSWGVPESEISHFLVFQLFLLYSSSSIYNSSISNGWIRCSVGVFSLRQRDGKTARADSGTSYATSCERRLYSNVFLSDVRDSSGGRCWWRCEYYFIFPVPSSFFFASWCFLVCDIIVQVRIVVDVPWFTAMMFCFSGCLIWLLPTEMFCGRNSRQSRLDMRRWVISAKDKWSSAGRKPSNIGTFWISSLKLAALLKLTTSNFVYIVHS